MKLLFVVLYFLALISCASFIQEEADSESVDCSALESVLKQYSLVIRPEHVVFKTTPFDYQVDLPKPNFPVPFNSYLGCVNQLKLDYFLKVHLEMFSALYPGLAEVPVHQHDITGLVVFGIIRLIAQDEPSDTSQIISIISDLCDNFDPYSTLLAVLKAMDSLVKQEAFDLLFQLAVESNCFYTVEAFFATGLKKISKNLFLQCTEVCEHFGDLRMRNRVASGLEVEDRFQISIQYAGYSIWPFFELISTGNTKIPYGKVLGRNLEFSSEFLIPCSQDPNVSRSYKVSYLLEEGGYGSCFTISSNDSKKKYALKLTLKESLRTYDSIYQEIGIQSSLNHENIVQLYHVFEDESHIYMIMELCEQQNLFEMLTMGRLHEDKAAAIMLQTFQALDYLHKNRIVHRDVKLENLFVKHGMIVKLGDFGLADYIFTETEKKYERCGSASYCAPEIVSGRGYRFEVDIWSAGVVLFALLEGFLPFDREARSETLRRISRGAYKFLDHDSFSVEGRDLIREILVVDPMARPQISKILAHPFFTSKGEQD